MAKLLNEIEIKKPDNDLTLSNLSNSTNNRLPLSTSQNRNISNKSSQYLNSKKSPSSTSKQKVDSSQNHKSELKDIFLNKKEQNNNIFSEYSDLTSDNTKSIEISNNIYHKFIAAKANVSLSPKLLKKYELLDEVDEYQDNDINYKEYFYDEKFNTIKDKLSNIDNFKTDIKLSKNPISLSWWMLKSLIFKEKFENVKIIHGTKTFVESAFLFKINSEHYLLKLIASQSLNKNKNKKYWSEIENCFKMITFKRENDYINNYEFDLENNNLLWFGQINDLVLCTIIKGKHKEFNKFKLNALLKNLFFSYMNLQNLIVNSKKDETAQVQKSIKKFKSLLYFALSYNL